MVFILTCSFFYFLTLVLRCTTASAAAVPCRDAGLVSYVFYGWANPPWALIMFASTIVDYFCGLRC